MVKNCYECEYENYHECILTNRTNRHVEALDTPLWCPLKPSRAKSLVQAYKKMNRGRKIEFIAGAIIWAVIWALVGMITANALIGYVVRF